MRTRPAGPPADRSRAPDAELIDAARAGHTELFGELVRRHRQRVATTIGQRVGRWEEVEDLVQDTLLKAFLGLESLRQVQRFGCWLTVLARHVASGYAGRESRQRRLLHDGLWVEPSWNGELPGTALERADEAEQLRRALAALPRLEREAVWLHHAQGIGLAALSARLGTTRGVLRGRLARGRALLRAEMCGKDVPAAHS